MKLHLLSLGILSCTLLQAAEHMYDWIVVGAGPAGLVTTGILLDLGIDKNTILVVDPSFNVGRLGEKYGTIPANTQTKLFVEFINACNTFRSCNSSAIQSLYMADPEKYYNLQIIIDPLQDISDYICTLVHTRRGYIQALDFVGDDWCVIVNGECCVGRHVVLATGAHPRSLDYQVEAEIPLDIALNKELLASYVTEKDSIAVIGGAHSAVLVMKFLSELSIKRLLNFYQRPLIFPVDNGKWVDHLYEGLKGIAAQWAHEHLEKNWPANLVRIVNTPESREAWLPVCNKIVYAVGYDRNQLPLVNGSATVSHDSLTGQIGTRLFGIGIAFPEIHTYPTGVTAARIGLNSFMEYAQRLIPQWLLAKGERTRARLRVFEELFTIDAL